MIQVGIPATVPLNEFDYNAVINKDYAYGEMVKARR